MKRTYQYIGLALVAALGLSSCSDKFLEDKKNYGAVGEEIYNYEAGAQGRINDLYGWCLPTVTDMSWKNPAVGKNDLAGVATEEYAGFNNFIDPEVTMSSTTAGTAVENYFGDDLENVQNNTYGTIRNINNAIQGITNSTLSQELKDKLLGQAYFFRAWTYYKLVKWYGGVPIVKDVLPATPAAFTQRSSAKECFEFIIDDLNTSARMLEGKTMDYGRITAGTALALKGRVLTLWCSPMFNRKGDQTRYQEAYTIMKEDLAKIDACGYGLYGEGTPGINASTFANMFVTSERNPEAVFVTLYNKLVDFSGYADAVKNNRWERDIRPGNTGGGGLTPSKALVDLFPMSDGKVPATASTYTRLEKSAIDYDERYPFMDRDPRFYRTFAFPGFRWAYGTGSYGDATKMDPRNPSYNNGNDYVLWNYVWFYGGDPVDPENTTYRGADNLNKPGGVLVRKKSDDWGVKQSPLYDYRPDGQGAKNGGEAVPFCSAAPLMEIRYAEVLLNLAEVACGAGDMSYAVEQLQRIRARAGYTSDNNYGLQSSLTGDQAACMSAILYERQSEFAYEGKRFDDMRRWLLFDGGVKPSWAPDTWQLSGIWGSNTCTWLGFKPFNGQRCETFIYKVNDSYGMASDDTYDKDPLLQQQWTADAQAYVDKWLADHPDATEEEKKAMTVDYAKTIITIYDTGAKVRNITANVNSDDLQNQLIALKKWYEGNLTWQLRQSGRYSDHSLKTIYFNPRNYFLGLKSNVSQKNVGIYQTVGWEDVNNGGAMGTFDPLAE